MNEFNTYLNNLDYSFIKDLCERKGKVHTYRKGDFFIRQHEKKRFAGWVEDGTFQYTHIDELVSIQAITDCSVYEISHHDMIEYWETNMETQRFGRCVAENLYEMVYERLLDSYCSPEIRYKRLMERCPNLKEAVPLKNIASFLGVTPETVSHIRRKLRK